MRITLVHLSESDEDAPSHIQTAIKQIFTISPQAQLTLVDREATLHYTNGGISLGKKVEPREVFNNPHSQGFWRYCIERFYYLLAWAETHLEPQDSFFHIENDIMVYQPIERIEELCRGIDDTTQIWATFDCDKRCIPGLIWFRNPKALRDMCIHMSTSAQPNDMFMIGEYRQQFPNLIKAFPVIPDPKGPHGLGEYFIEFGTLFDAAAIGQYMGGTFRGPKMFVPPFDFSFPYDIGFENETSAFLVKAFKICWKQKGDLWFPFAGEIPIANLHIHSKQLSMFQSSHFSFYQKWKRTLQYAIRWDQPVPPIIPCIKEYFCGSEDSS